MPSPIHFLMKQHIFTMLSQIHFLLESAHLYHAFPVHSLSETAHLYHAFTNSFSIGNRTPLSCLINSFSIRISTPFPCLYQFILYRKQHAFPMPSPVHSLLVIPSPIHWGETGLVIQLARLHDKVSKIKVSLQVLQKFNILKYLRQWNQDRIIMSDRHAHLTMVIQYTEQCRYIANGKWKTDQTTKLYIDRQWIIKMRSRSHETYQTDMHT